MIDLRNPLVRVGEAMPWQTLIDAVGASLPAIPAGAGRRPLPARLMLGLLYLKYAYDLSDEAVVQRWMETPTGSTSAARCSSRPACLAIRPR